jgi:glycosyltransferase involved in cell wall biosynthesis
MAAGVPVIGILPSKSEVSRMIQEEGCGVVIKPGDIEGLVETIKNLVNNSQGLKSMRENGKKAIKNKYSLSLAANSYYDIICALNNTLKEVK